MSLPSFNTKSPTIKRILKEASELSSHPDASLHASPLDSDLFEWHFTLAGPPSTPYAEGIYHGRITLPPLYPLRPPSFRFLTPSGRFEVNREICLSISGHHEETWQPAWGIRTALWALRAFMEGGAKGQVGGMEMGKEERERLARESRGWRCGGCGGRSGEEILREERERVERVGEGAKVEGDGEGEGEGEGAKVEGERQGGREREKEEIPPELKLGIKDETKKGGETKTPVPSPPSSSSSSHPISPPPPPSLPPPPPPPPHHPDSAPVPVPAWIDKAIAGVAAGLLVMLVRKVVF